MGQIVINLPKDVLDRLRATPSPTHTPEDLFRLVAAVRTGEILPPHDDLIDVSGLEPDTEWSSNYDDYMAYSIAQVLACPVVIPSNLLADIEDRR